MKKTTTFRQSALVGAPGLASGFVPSIPNAIKISVNLRNVDIKIYGFAGSQWELLHDTDGTQNSYATDVVHQKYYFESKNGELQTISASFLSSDSRSIEQPRFGVSRATRKLHDIEEVPLYNSQDSGKFLTVRSDGSLAWLAADESFIVESEGEEEGGGNPPPSPPPPPPQANFLEELDRFNFTNGIINDTGSGMGHRAVFNLNTDNIIAYGADGQPAEEEFTISWWMYINSSQDAGNISLFGNYALPNRFACSLGGNKASNIHFSTYIGTQVMFNNNTGIGVADQWTHVAYTCKSNGSNLILSLYVNGNKLNGTKSFPLGTKLLPSLSNPGISIGGSGMSGKSAKGQFDSIQIEDGIALTDAQVAAIAAQTDRQMGIGAASQL